VEIDLRQHEDGAFVLEVKHKNFKREVDVTKIVHHIVVDKIKELQRKLQLEKRYRNWMVEAAQETTKSLSTVATRYEQLMARLKETNRAITELADAWRKGRRTENQLRKLEQVAEQNQHFLENDSALKKIPTKE
jgi:hypothetical protein